MCELVGHHPAHRVAEDESSIGVDRRPRDAELAELPPQHLLDGVDSRADERDVALRRQEIVGETGVPAADRFSGKVVVGVPVGIENEEPIFPVGLVRRIAHQRERPVESKTRRRLRAAMQRDDERQPVPAVFGKHPLVPVVPANRRIELELPHDSVVDELIRH